MSLDDLGNLGEFIGAIGVVISFVFLAVQIRRNTQAIRDTAEKDMAQHTAEFLSPIVENAEVARIFRVGLREWDKLDDNDRMRFSMHLFGMFFYFQHLYSRHRQGQLDPEYWHGQKEVILWYIRQPGVQSWWPKAKSRLNRTFVEFLEAERDRLVDTSG